MVPNFPPVLDGERIQSKSNVETGLKGLLAVNSTKRYPQGLSSTSSIVPGPNSISVDVLYDYDGDLLFVVKKKTPLKYSIKLINLNRSYGSIRLPMCRRNTVQQMS